MGRTYGPEIPNGCLIENRGERWYVVGPGPERRVMTAVFVGYKALVEAIESGDAWVR